MRSMFRTIVVVAIVVMALGAATSASAHEWLVNGKPITATGAKEATSAGGSFVMSLLSGKVIECKNTSGKWSIKSKGAGEAKEFLFTGCTVNAKACTVNSVGQPPETIKLSEIKTQLVEREVAATKQKVLADEFKENTAKEEFATLQFKVENHACSGFPETKVTGEVAAEVINSSETLNFPSPQLKGNALFAYGLAMSWQGSFKQSLTGGGTLEGV
jgi:hypothetical protein